MPVLVNFSVLLHVFVKLDDVFGEVLVHRAGVLHVLLVELVAESHIVVIDATLDCRNHVMLVNSERQVVLVGSQVLQLVHHMQ